MDNFEQHITDALHAAKRSTRRPWIVRLGIATAAAAVVIALLVSNVRLRRHRAALADEYADFKAQAIQQIDTLAAELQTARDRLEKTQQQADLLAAQNADLKQLAQQARQLMDDLNQATVELDQAHTRIKELLAVGEQPPPPSYAAAPDVY